MDVGLPGWGALFAVCVGLESNQHSQRRRFYRPLEVTILNRRAQVGLCGFEPHTDRVSDDCSKPNELKARKRGCRLAPAPHLLELARLIRHPDDARSELTQHFYKLLLGRHNLLDALVGLRRLVQPAAQKRDTAFLEIVIPG